MKTTPPVFESPPSAAIIAPGGKQYGKMQGFERFGSAQVFRHRPADKRNVHGKVQQRVLRGAVDEGMEAPRRDRAHVLGGYRAELVLRLQKERARRAPLCTEKRHGEEQETDRRGQEKDGGADIGVSQDQFEGDQVEAHNGRVHKPGRRIIFHDKPCDQHPEGQDERRRFRKDIP